MRTAVVGCGRVFERYYLPAIQSAPRFQLVAVCDSSPERLEWARGQIVNIPVFDRVESLIEQSRPEVLLVTSPPNSHVDHCMTALSRGIHVLVEKPYARSSDEWQRVVASANQAGALIWPARSRRYRAPYRRVKAWLAGRDAPSIEAIEFDLSFPIKQWDAVTGYLGDARLGGGVIEDVVSHQVDLLNWLLADEPLAAWVEAESATSTPGRRLDYRLKYPSGLVARCIAEHSEHYREQVTLTVHQGRSRIVASDSLAARLPRRLDWVAGASHRVYRRLRRLLVRSRLLPDVTLESFELQLTAFAIDLARHRSGESTASTDRWPLGLLLVIEAVARAAQRPGSWDPVRQANLEP
jgi:predicted dehydrogenase